METMSQTELAELLGVSQQAVSKYIQHGKIPSHCIVKDGKYKRIIVDCAVTALDQSLSRTNGSRKALQCPPPPVVNTCGDDVVAPGKKPDITAQKKALRASGRELVTLAEAQEIKENYLALLRELEYEQKKGDLVPVDDVKKVIADLILTARGKILAIKGQIAPLVKEFIPDGGNFGMVMDRIEAEIHDILEEMASKSI